MPVTVRVEPNLLAIDVGQDGFVHAVVVIRIVRGVLEVELDSPGGGVQRDGGVGVQVVARMGMTIPRARLADTPVDGVEDGVIGSRHPRRTAAVLVGVARPRVAARLTGGRNGVRLPHFFTRLGVARRNEAANTELSARGADDDLAVDGQGHYGEAVGGFVVGHGVVPNDLTAGGIEGDQVAIQGGNVEIGAIEGRAAVDHVTAQMREDVARQRVVVTPHRAARPAIHAEDVVVGGTDEQVAIEGHRLATLAVQDAERQDHFGTKSLTVSVLIWSSWL